MNYTIDYYFDLQSIDNENVVDILKNIIDSNNISDEPLDYQFEILDNETQQIIFKGGEATTTIPYRYFEEVADYLTNRKREVEEERSSFLDSLFKPTKPKEEEEVVVENPPTDNIPEPTNDEIPASTDEEYVSPSMDSIFQEPSPPMDTQVQPEVPMIDAQVQPEVSMIDTQVQPEVPIMDSQIQQQQPLPIMDTQIQQQPVPMINNQMYQGGNVKSSIIIVRIIIQKMKSLPFLFLKKMRYNPTNNFI